MIKKDPKNLNLGLVNPFDMLILEEREGHMRASPAGDRGNGICWDKKGELRRGRQVAGSGK